MAERATAVGLGVVLCLAVSQPARAAGKVQPVPAFSGPAAPSVKQALEPAGYHVVLSDGSAACDVWLRKDGPGLAPSALVGVLTFPANTHDFRGQPIKAGSYTLRYGVMPSDGNHLGAAPTSDFLLLVPLADDKDAAATPEFTALVAMSAKAAGQNHPAPLNLAAVPDRKDFPAVAANENGHEVFYVKLKTAKGEVPIGLVVKGQTDH
jgi:hypothetical protein